MLENLLTINNITDESNQRHVIEKEGGNVTIVLRYHQQIETWTLDVERGEKANYGIRLAGGVRLMPSMNMGVDFFVFSEDGLDPFQASDFASGRCQLVIADVV